MAQAKVNPIQFQHGSERTVYTTWEWKKSYTDHYEIKWLYATGDGVGFIGSKTTITEKQSTYDAPTNATHVAFYVKPVSKKHKVNGKEVSYWTADWSTVERYYLSDNPPSVPPTPSVEVKDFSLTARVDDVSKELHGTHIEFQIVKNDTSTFNTGKAEIRTNSASYICTLAAGNEYKVRARSIRDDLKSEWSSYSSNIGTVPEAPAEITEIRALRVNDGSGSVYLEWSKVANAEGYTIEYTKQKSRFDSSTEVQSTSVDSVVSHAEIVDLEIGTRWFFRVRADNDQGSSAWTEIKSVKVGTVPAAPTTWSSRSTIIVGEPLVLYWTHNTEDGSDQVSAKVEFTIGNSTVTHKIFSADCLSLSSDANKVANLSISSDQQSDFELSVGQVVKVEMRSSNSASNPTLNVSGTGAKPIRAEAPYDYKWNAGAVVVFIYDGIYWNILDDDADMNTTSYAIDTSGYPEGTKIKWRVCTRGIMSQYSNWSIERTVDIYAPPIVEMRLVDQPTFSFSEGNDISILNSFPFYVLATAGPNTQTPIGYHISIIADETYETIDNVGNRKVITQGDEVYSKFFDITGVLLIELSAGVLSLENNISYTVKCQVSMDSGLTAEASLPLAVSWIDTLYWPDAEIGYDEETYSALIRPYCEDDNGSLVEGITLSVYRREFDGSFTEIAKGIDNTQGTYVTDPHPSLDFARYRIVAITNDTGSVSYYDAPGYPVGEKGAIIQWDEEWSNFDTTNEDVLEEPTWTGSLLRLPYNFDVSDTYDKDVEKIKYIGRRNPVCYYGTQVGEKQSWSLSIPKEDIETLYALRRLAAWMGDVYVREPSGSGYWANVTVGYSKKHRDVTIPVTIEVTRVEGGM